MNHSANNRKFFFVMIVTKVFSLDMKTAVIIFAEKSEYEFMKCRMFKILILVYIKVSHAFLIIDSIFIHNVHFG